MWPFLLTPFVKVNFYKTISNGLFEKAQRWAGIYVFGIRVAAWQLEIPE
jgi:hypothetical protein